jgi:HlyD family secretion protein
MANTQQKTGTVILILLVLAGIAGWIAWDYLQCPELAEGFASGNGRIEATEYDIATKRAARVDAVLVQEGDRVEAGQVLARMDTDDLEAQLREALAGLREARESKEYALAIVSQRRSELSFAKAEFVRSQQLVENSHVSQEKLDQDRTAELTAEAALQAAHINVRRAEAAVEAAVARTERLTTDVEDSTLKAPISGRVLYRLAEPGEVLGAGGKVLTVLDLTDVYMTVFLPTGQAGRVRVGSEARILLDAAPEYRIPAQVSFVAARAQFTPKAVETRSEREKLMFRVKVRIDPALLRDHIEKVKTGVPGVVYLRLGDDLDWPEGLTVRLPE